MNSDNKFGKCCKCPARMSDSRIYTNYSLNSNLVSHIKKVNKLKNDTEFRHFLQKNSNTMMKNERVFLKKKKCDFSKK